MTKAKSLRRRGFGKRLLLAVLGRSDERRITKRQNLGLSRRGPCGRRKHAWVSTATVGAFSQSGAEPINESGGYKAVAAEQVPAVGLEPAR